MHKRLTWQDLREKTELSKGALSKHLNEMLKNGDIKPEIELSSQGQRQTVYSLITESKEEIKANLSEKRSEEKDLMKPEEFQYYLDQLQLLAFASGLNIKALEDRKQAEAIFKEYLDFYLDTIASYIPYFISLARSYSIGYSKGRGNLPLKKQYEIFVKRLNEEFINKILLRWIEAIAYSIFLNSDITSKEQDGHNPLTEYIEHRGKAIDKSYLDKIERVIEENKKKSAPQPK